MACSAVRQIYDLTGCCPNSLSAPTCFVWNDTASFSAPSARASDANAYARLLANVLEDEFDVESTRYDLTEVVVNDTTYCPFVFASTLRHDEGVELPRCDDVRTWLTFLQCPTREHLASVPRSQRATAKIYGMPDARARVSWARRARLYRLVSRTRPASTRRSKWVRCTQWHIFETARWSWSP